MKSDCIEWEGPRYSRGYGRARHEGKQWQAHRLAWFLKHGQIPKGICVLHSCDNPPCVNVGHLFLGTHKDNMRDMAQKGRGVGFKKGEKPCNAKLTESDALEIRGLLAQGVVQKRIAEKFGVHQTTISLVKLGKRWKSLLV